MKFTLSWFAQNPLPLRGGDRGRGETPHSQNLHAMKRELSSVAHHPAPQPPPLKRRGSAAALSEIQQ
jgi:hypothetical protein